LSTNSDSLILLIAFIVKALLGLAAFFGGIYAIYRGANLIKQGVGNQKSESEILMKLGTHTIKLSTNTVGTYLIATSVLWIFFGWLITPNLQIGTNKVDGVLPSTDTFLRAYQFEAGSAVNKGILEDPEQLKKLFEQAVRKKLLHLDSTNKRKPVSNIDLGLELNDPYPDGTTCIGTTFRIDNEIIKMRFHPRIENGQIVFKPTRIEVDSISQIGSELDK